MEDMLHSLFNINKDKCMNEEPHIQPQLELIQNIENSIVSSMFDSLLKAANEPIETFTTWLLVATAAIASFLIVNADKIIPIITQSGFIVSGAFLCASCFSGILSRVYALQCKISMANAGVIRKTIAEHFTIYENEKRQIEEVGGNLQINIRFDRIQQEYLAIMPRWIQWLSKRFQKKHGNKPQAPYIILIGSLSKQGLLAFIQALFFIGFLVCGFIFTARNEQIYQPGAQKSALVGLIDTRVTIAK